MDACNIEVVGIILVFSKSLRRLRIQNVFKLTSPEGKEEIAVEESKDRQAVLTFSRTITVFERLYEQQIQKVWKSETEQVRKRYYQFDKVTMPSYACLPGEWLLWAERR